MNKTRDVNGTNDINKYEFLIIGTGLAGCVLANKISESGRSVLMLEKRAHIGGDAYDYVDNHGFLVHKYGPHILTTDNDHIIKYLSEYTDWHDVSIYLETFVDGRFIPLPINLNSINMLYGDSKETNSEVVIEELVAEYGMNTDVNVIDLLNSKSALLKRVADDICDKVYVGYNQKMWGLRPQEVSRDILGRIPIRISHDNKKYHMKYEVVPLHGWTMMLEKMLDEDNITVVKNVDAFQHIETKNGHVYFDGRVIHPKVICTGPIDGFFGYCHGELPYRALCFKKVIKNKDYEFKSLSVTYPQNYKKTRTTEMKKITGQRIDGQTALVSEYPGEYVRDSKNYGNPSYPVDSENSRSMLKQYVDAAKALKNVYFVGRLAEYKYYNMEESILSALRLFKRINSEL